jgi:DNA-binding NarL/FixJ family response regulator
MPTQCSRDLFGFEAVEGRRVVAAFDGGEVTCDAGALLLGAIDRAIGLIERFASCFIDARVQAQVEHGIGAIVVYSGLEDASLPRRVMALGGAAFCSKRVSPEELRDVVAAVAAGRIVFPYEAAHGPADPLVGLTEREAEILKALAGDSNAGQLAHALGISPNTLKFHLKNIYQKLGVANRSQAVARYFSANLPRRPARPHRARAYPKECASPSWHAFAAPPPPARVAEDQGAAARHRRYGLG